MAERAVGPAGRSSRWTADLEDEGDVSGEIVGVKRSLFNFLDAAERLAPHAPGENFAGCSSVDSCADGGGGGVVGTEGSCGVLEFFAKKFRLQRDVTPFVVGTD